jgi:hypothetical protein
MNRSARGTPSRYRVIAPAEASNYLHSKVRITRRGIASVLEGRLARGDAQAGANTVTVQQQRFGGTMLMNIPFSDVTKLEVLIPAQR